MAIEHIQKMKWPAMAFLSTLAFVLWLPDLMIGLVETYTLQLTSMPTVTVQVNGTCATLLTMLLVMVNGWIVSDLVYRLNISQTHNFLTLFTYVFACSCLPTLHRSVSAQLGILCFLMMLFALNDSWRRRDTAELGLRCGLLCILAACFIPHMLYALPWVMIGFMLQGSLTFRTFLSVLLGYSCYFIPLLLQYAFPQKDYSALNQQVLSPFTNWEAVEQMWADFLQWQTHLHLYILLGAALLFFFLFISMNTSGREALPRPNRYNVLLAGFFVLALADMNAPVAITSFTIVFTQMILQARKNSHRGWYFTLYICLMLFYYLRHLAILNL